MKLILSMLVLVGCGASDPQKKAADSIGRAANTVREYLSDRGMSGEKIESAAVDAREGMEEGGEKVKAKTEELYDKAKGYLQDRNLTSEDVATGTMDAKDYVGERANAARRYFNERGLRDVREGDIETTSRVGSLETTSADHEARLAVLEAIADAHKASLAALQSALEAEADARVLGDSGAAADLADAVAAMSAQLSDAVDMLSLDLAEISDMVADQGSDISELSGRVDSIEAVLADLDSVVSDSVDDAIEVLKNDPDFLASIKGDKGDAGADGADGQDASCCVTTNSVSFKKYIGSSHWAHTVMGDEFSTITLSIPTVTCN